MLCIQCVDSNVSESKVPLWTIYTLLFCFPLKLCPALVLFSLHQQQTDFVCEIFSCAINQGCARSSGKYLIRFASLRLHNVFLNQVKANKTNWTSMCMVCYVFVSVRLYTIFSIETWKFSRNFQFHAPTHKRSLFFIKILYVYT